MTKTWSLEDASGMAKEAPYTFYLPSAELLSQLGVGDLVKLIFRCPVENERNWSAERMWVEIVSRHDDQFRGRLKNTPSYIPDLTFDDELDFRSCHIIQTQREDSIVHLTERYASKCFVTRKVVDEGCSVNYLARDEIDEEGQRRNFSGWTLSAGDETDEYLDDPENWCFVSLGLVLNIDDRFRALLDAEHTVDKEFIWDDQLKTYCEMSESD